MNYVQSCFQDFTNIFIENYGSILVWVILISTDCRMLNVCFFKIIINKSFIRY